MIWILGIAGLLAMVVLYDLVQRKHAILRNFPIIGHFRYMLEAVGPELRQYIVTSNNEELPFSRDQRGWIYASAKRRNNYAGFGTDNNIEGSTNYLIIKHDMLGRMDTHHDEGRDPAYSLPCAKVLGGHRRRRNAFRPASVVNVSGMSFGSLSGPAVEAMNRGAAICGCLHNTGEGGISPHHLHGGELIWQIGTAYFGCRTASGHFDRAELPAQGRGAPGPRDRDQAEPGRQAGPRRRAAGREGDGGDRRHPRRARSARPSSAPEGTAPSTASTRCSTSSRTSPTPPACRSA